MLQSEGAGRKKPVLLVWGEIVYAYMYIVFELSKLMKGADPWVQVSVMRTRP